MSQSVNLYLPEFRKKQESLSALRMVQATGVVTVLLVLATLWQFWTVTRAESAWEAAEAQRVAAVEATAALQASFGAQAPDMSVVDQNIKLEEALKEKRAILEFMSGRRLGNTSGFSSYLVDLARHHVAGLSLQNIVLSDTGQSVTLSGEVARAELVPIYLQNLNNGASFRGLNFNSLQIAEMRVPALVGLGAAAQAQPVFGFTVATGQSAGSVQ